MNPGWPLQRLADICETFTDGDWIESKDQSSGGIRLIQTGNVGEGRFKDRSERARYISEATFKRLRCTEIFPGDCLISRLPDPVGRSCILPNVGERMITAVDCTVVRFKSDKMLPQFFNYYAQSDNYLDAVNCETTGTTRSRISRTKLGEINIPVPPIPEQKRIVEILDRAFEAITQATNNAEKNLENARSLFETHLKAAFAQGGMARASKERTAPTAVAAKTAPARGKVTIAEPLPAEGPDEVTRTRGREATLRRIAGPLSLAVGRPDSEPRKGWRWTPLTDLARLESGHTPSRRRPEYWGGEVPWIGIQDARDNHGGLITDTQEHTNSLGIENSSARVLPAKTVCLSRTASVGYVVVMARSMATSQDFVNWVCSSNLNPDFLKFLFLAEGREGLLRYASGAVHQTIYFPEAKAFYVCHPAIEEQARIVNQCDAISEASHALQRNYEQKLHLLAVLKQAALGRAFSGALVRDSEASNTLSFPKRLPNITSTELHAGILACAYDLHVKNNLREQFGHVKAEKIAHMVEAAAGIDLGRSPVKDAAGPNDYPHLIKVEHRARKAGYFDFQRVNGAGYRVKKLSRFDALIDRTREALGDCKRSVDEMLTLMLPMTTQQAEVFATVYAAWNNLLIDGKTPTDEQIVFEARENWHPEKLKIPREKFFKAIEWLRQKRILPRGGGRKVGVKPVRP